MWDAKFSYLEHGRPLLLLLLLYLLMGLLLIYGITTGPSGQLLGCAEPA
jgi:hypothetical protein